MAPHVFGGAKRFFVLAVGLGTALGLLGGLLSVLRNEYLGRDMGYLALHEVAANVNGFLVLSLFTAAVLTIVLGAVVRLPRTPRRVGLLGVAVLGAAAALALSGAGPGIIWEPPRTNRLSGLLVLLVLIAAFDLFYLRRRVSPWMEKRRVVSWLVLCLLLVGAVNGARAWRSAALRSSVAGADNVLILVVDALRADRLASAGYLRSITPNIDSLATRGVVFTQAVSNSNHTRATVPAIFTLQFPTTHGIRGTTTRSVDVLPFNVVTVAEIMRNAGFSTQAYIPNPNMKRRWHFDQGFAIYDDAILVTQEAAETLADRYETAETIHRKFLGWLEENPDRPFFTYIHYTDVHAPYVPPAPYDTMYYDPDGDRRPITDEEYRRMPRYQRLEDDHGDLNYYVARYDAEIRYTDAKIRELLDRMAELGVLDRTLIVLTADHGEAFLEHGDWEHGSALYDEQVHVPLIFRFPGDEYAGRVVDAPAHTFDISATALDHLGLTLPQDAQARSLLPIVRDPTAKVWDYAYSENIDVGMKSLRNREWKYILHQDGRQELYNLAMDPAELEDRSGDEPDVLAGFRERLNRFILANRIVGRSVDLRREELDAETIEQLRALGYIN